uniref:Uncharacterized protein n=1 Tax=Anguilla anguilla TaxID=7936 RepID=A0A0E9PJY2_ANGAN
MALKGLTGCIRILLHNVKTKGVVCANITKRSDRWTCRVGGNMLVSIRMYLFQSFKPQNLKVS